MQLQSVRSPECLRTSANTTSKPFKKTKKPKEYLGFVSIYRLLADAGFSLGIGDIGLDSLRLSQGIRGIAPELAIKLANIDVSSLWKTLEDDDRISTLLFLEQLQRVREG